MRPGSLAIFLFFMATAASAQFKWIDASGRVGYGDKPPADAHDIERLDGVAKGSKPDALANLPFQLRSVMQKFPVTLYTQGNCAGCDRGRELLKSRAIPFTERTVVTGDDVKALKRLTGSERLPVFQVGGQILTGFHSGNWDEALNVAGYPAEKLLPPDWQWPAPKPLTEPVVEADTAPAPAPSPEPAAQ